MNDLVEVKKGDGVVKIYVVRPNNEQIKNADRYRAKTWNQCIMEGILTRKEVEKLMIQRGLWAEGKNVEEKEITDQIQKLTQTLYLGKDGAKMKLSEGKDIAIKIRELRIKLTELIQEKIAVQENTAEALADNARFDHLVSSCTFYEGGEKVYSSIEDYNSKSSDEVAFAAASKLGEILYNLDSKFQENFPENKWLKKFNLVDDDLSLINKSGDHIDTKGRTIDEDGYYLDENKNRVDKDGNPLTSDGIYELKVEYEDDLNANTDSN